MLIFPNDCTARNKRNITSIKIINTEYKNHDEETSECGSVEQAL